MYFFKFLSSRKRFYIYKSLLFLNLLVVFNANFSLAESEIYLNNKNSTKEDNVK